jgi:hypothetical protein
MKLVQLVNSRSTSQGFPPPLNKKGKKAIPVTGREGP